MAVVFGGLGMAAADGAVRANSRAGQSAGYSGRAVTSVGCTSWMDVGLSKSKHREIIEGMSDSSS